MSFFCFCLLNKKLRIGFMLIFSFFLCAVDFIKKNYFVYAKKKLAIMPMKLNFLGVKNFDKKICLMA